MEKAKNKIHKHIKNNIEDLNANQMNNQFISIVEVLTKPLSWKSRFLGSSYSKVNYSKTRSLPSKVTS